MSDSFQPPEGPNDHDADDKPMKLKLKVKGTVPLSEVKRLVGHG